MIAEIIPLTRLPKSLSYFDYEVPQNFEGQIKIGQLVKISFRGRLVNGIVSGLKDKPDKIKTAVKPLIKILDREPEMASSRLKLLWWISDYYSVSPALLLKNLIPEPLTRVSVFKTKSELKPVSLSVSRQDIPRIQKNLKKFFESKKDTFLFHYQSQKNKIAFFLKVAGKILAQNKSVLILEPQITDINSILPYFLYLFAEKVAVLHGNMSKTEYWQNWQKIKNNKAKIVIGTRSAILAPTNNLGLTIINSEEMSDFKQTNQNPYYDARIIVLKLAELTTSRVIFASQAPRVETYYQTKEKKYEILEEKFAPELNARLIDMTYEFKKENFLSLSEELQEKIKETLDSNRRVVLLLNRRGGSTLLVCRDCGYIFICQDCRTPLICHEEECNVLSKFLCRHCGHEEEVQLHCPKCRGVSIKFLGTGTQRVAREIKKLFPGTKVARIDKDVKSQIINYELQNIDIFVGTQFFIKNFLPHITNIGLIGIISADTLLLRPDFRSGEKTFEWLVKLINYGKQIKSPILIQTFLLNNFVIQSAVSQNYEAFYNQEIRERKNLGYPPFVRLAKLSFRHPNEKKCFFEFEKLFKELDRDWGKKIETLREEKVKKDKQKFIAVIIIKFKPELTDKILKYFKKIPDGWTIDMDSENLL